ncbi:hypothetical protein [Prauserella aidingensis]|nr:hypothetical protein [Prauserella aidingensis]
MRESAAWSPGGAMLTECGRLIDPDSPETDDVDPCPVCFPADVAVPT